MNVALIGATGRAGGEVLAELLRRGHEVTALARTACSARLPAGVEAHDADITDPKTLSPRLRGHDAVISAAWFHPGSSEPLVEAVVQSGVRRALFMGGASSLLDEEGRMLVDVLDMPCDWMPTIREGVHLLHVLRTTNDLDWTFISPPLEIEAGPRRGTYCTDPDHLVTDAEGRSAISFADYAIAMVDALENGSAIRGRFAVGY
ncbi:NAD(P)-dependent oxidoreductase [Novosphingobium malaysiense]|uniref:NAD(P)-binding domain-containing protein n=1 Tax=Novosphingobium malaysiense TaxID=1348853 RepID=A0A0B1ZQP6_9SPHN|nr:NAD(P)H-binding protein [Novosphingobium malaysiense]KHK92921.1 hypothetical protein LK12_00550 [Novosphingobium malaysiense]